MLSTPALGALLLPFAALFTPTLAGEAYQSSNSEDIELPKDNNANCSCYVVSSGAKSDTPSYFQYYRFYDFRNLNNGFVNPPPRINNTQNASLVPGWQPQVLNSDAFNADWVIQNWSKPATEDFPTPMSNSPANVYVSQEGNGTYLTLRTSKLNDHQTAAEIENHQKNLMHVSMRMSARVLGSKGAVAGFFTYYDDTNESDVEILTSDPTDKIRYTNQPALDKEGNEVSAASVAASNLPKWSEWQTHRIDWLPKNSYWYLNDKQVAANTYSVPRKPSFLVVNMWSDGGEWSGNMSVGDAAEFQIQWIEMTFNTSGPYQGIDSKQKRDVKLETRKSKRCETVCKIDGVEELGTPEIVSQNFGGDDDDDDKLSGGAIAGIVIGVLAFVLILCAVGYFFWRRRNGKMMKGSEHEMKTKEVAGSERT